MSVCIQIWKLRSYLGKSILFLWGIGFYAIPIYVVFMIETTQMSLFPFLLPLACAPYILFNLALKANMYVPWLWLLGVEQYFYHLHMEITNNNHKRNLAIGTELLQRIQTHALWETMHIDSSSSKDIYVPNSIRRRLSI